MHRAIAGAARRACSRGRELSPFLRRPGNRDCLRVLGKLEGWFLRQYDVHHAAVMIQHARTCTATGDDGDRVLSRHRTRNYVLVLALLAAPFLVAAFAYDAAPGFFDAVCSASCVLANVGVMWFLLYRFLWRRDLAFFHASVPRIMAGIIVGYLPIFFIDEVWSLVARSFFPLATIAVVRRPR